MKKKTTCPALSMLYSTVYLDKLDKNRFIQLVQVPDAGELKPSHSASSVKILLSENRHIFKYCWLDEDPNKTNLLDEQTV